MTARELAEQRHAHQARQEGSLRHTAEEAREGNLVTVVCESTSSELVSVEAMGPMAPADMAKCAKAAAQIGASLHSIFRSLA